MFERLRFTLIATSLLVSPVLAQSTCAPEKLSAAIDAYANQPFGARAWRKLNGLGDLGVDGESYVYDSYGQQREWSELVAKLSPANNALANPGYNCRIGYPLEILKARVAKFGSDSDYVRLWLKSQEAVMSACDGKAMGDMPEPTPTNAMKAEDLALLQNDRAYQKATILFYASPTTAIPAFKAIAASNSPHKAAARYNVANLLANAKNVVEARSEAKAILADASLAAVHPITRELLGYIANLEDTATGWADLIDNTVDTLSQPIASVAGKPDAEATLKKALYDIGYAGVTAKKDDWWVTNTLPADATLSKALADAARKHPMVLWMMAGQSIDKPNTLAPWALIGPQWRDWTKSYLDRALALQTQSLPTLPLQVLNSLRLDLDDAGRANLWAQSQAAAEKAMTSCGDAPETGAVTQLALQAMRASALANRFEEIYAGLPKLKLETTASYRQYLLPKLIQHILASGNVEEGRRLRAAFLSDAQIKILTVKDQEWQLESFAQFLALMAEDDTQWLKANGLMAEKLSPTVFNLLPAAKLQELSSAAIFSPEQKAVMKRAAWTRDFARGRQISEKNTADMLSANPELAAEMAAIKTSYPKLSNERVLLLTILRNPRFGILVNSPDGTEPIEAKREKFSDLDEYDANDKNWWCPIEINRQLAALRTEYDETANMTGPKEYYAQTLKPVLAADALNKANAARDIVLAQHPMLKAVDWKEITGLAKAPSGPAMLSKAAIRWGKASKPDDAAAEALALAVRATRYGCRWHGSHEAYSKPAQELLKAKFATSTWAAQTPYWFGCMDTQYDAQYNKIANCKPRTWPTQDIPGRKAK